MKQKHAPQKKVTTKAASSNPKLFRIKIISVIIIAGLLLSLLFHLYEATQLGKNYYPYNTFLFKPIDRFNDYYSVYKEAMHLNPYSFSLGNYFPFAYTAMFIFTLFPEKFSFFLFAVSFIAFFVVYLYKQMPVKAKLNKLLAVFIFSFMAYPFLYLIDRGNLEAWIFMSLALFTYYYLKKNDKISILFLSAAIALKLYPAFLILLFIIERKYMKLIYTGLVVVILSLASAALFKGGILVSIKGLLHNLVYTNKYFVTGGSAEGLAHSTSLFVPLKLLYYNILTKINTIPPFYEEVFNKYYFIGAFIFVTVITYIIFKYNFIFWKKLALIIMTFVLLPQISGDYKLINIFIPLIFFINSEKHSKFDVAYSVLFGLLLIPKDYYIVVDDLSISSIINPICILSIIVLIIWEAIKSDDNLKLSLSDQ